MKTIGCIISFLTVLCACAQQKEKNNSDLAPAAEEFVVEKLVSGITIGWGMDWLPDGSMLITEKSGKLYRFKNGEKTEISNPPKVYHHGQGGLLDIRLHPDYRKNGWIYLTYASDEGPGNGGNTAVMRCRIEGNSLTDKEVLYKATPNTTAGQHFGSRLAFDTEGFLYFSVGDRGDRDTNPQDISRDGGKVYRLQDDGKIPKDNPFVHAENAKPAVFSYGHRNPQGMVRHPGTGAIWIHEHGPKGGDEINIIKKGANYGWPEITYGVNYDGTAITDKTEKKGMENPVFYWTPSIAPCGMDFVSGDKFPAWQGKLLVGSLKFGYVEMLTFENNKVVKREKLIDLGRTRNVRTGPDGYIYISVEGEGIFRLLPKNQ